MSVVPPLACGPPATGCGKGTDPAAAGDPIERVPAETASEGSRTADPVRILGVRHHGPGSARAVVRALDAHDPDIVLIEGPPEADALVTWVGRGLVPPVAVLAYDQTNPRRAAYWPYAEFSPEWQALKWAHEHQREVRFCDLPAAVVLAESTGRGHDPDRPQLPGADDDPAASPDRAFLPGGAEAPEESSAEPVRAGAPSADPAHSASPGRADPAAVSERVPAESSADPAEAGAPSGHPARLASPGRAQLPAAMSSGLPEESFSGPGQVGAPSAPRGTSDLPLAGPGQPAVPAADPGPPALPSDGAGSHPSVPDAADPAPTDPHPYPTTREGGGVTADTLRGDPLAVLARAAGYADPERWWDDMIEQRTTGDPFEAVGEAMTELRAAGVGELTESARLTEARREATMRQALRRAIKDADRVAVVCGAWHVPALSGKLPPASRDAALLRKLPKAKVTSAWVPWTHSRLAFASGYGAGIDSPGWYDHLFTSPDAVVERWMTAVAGVLRSHDLPVSSAHAIEATRLADTLAILRGRPTPGLDEVQEAALAVMCEGSTTSLRWVTSDLVVGEKLGAVPAEAPMVPLEADLRRLARSARLPIAADAKQLVLDLRKETDRAKSVLLHRLGVLGIAWGARVDISGTGTFKEGWSIAWRPEFAVEIVLASRFGTTVLAAAEAAVLDDPGDLPDVTARVERALTADLPASLPGLLRLLDERAAHDADVSDLLAALPALVRARRYGTVRGTDTGALAVVAEALLARACAGIPAAASGASPEAAALLRSHLDAVHLVIPLMGDEARDVWLTALGRLSTQGDCPGLLAGRATRILFDADELDAGEAGARLGRALSHGPSLAERAGFAEGFLAGSALLIVHDDHLVPIIDAWISRLTEEDFLEVVPVLRRAFGAYTRAERRQISQRVTRGDTTPSTQEDDLDWDRLAPVLATVELLLRGRS